MYQKLRTTTALMVCIFLLYSCASTSKTQSSDYDYMYITKQGIIQKPLITDLEIGKQRVSISRTYNNITVANAKENTMGEFVKQNSCDVIVQPFFTTNSENSTTRTTVSVTLTGYPAFYKNIRPYEPRDTAYLLPRGYFIMPSTTPLPSNSQTTVPVMKKKSAVGAVLGGLLLGGLVYAATLSNQ